MRAAWTPPAGRTPDERAFTVFQVAQLVGWSAAKLSHLTRDEWAAVVREIEAFPECEQRRILHLAYERRFRIQVLDALMANCHGTGVSPAARPSLRSMSSTPQCQRTARRFQAIFCIDEREESIRRHLEEVEPEVETFGAAGFFGVSMYYRGIGDLHAVPLCPVVMKPQHLVEEESKRVHARVKPRIPLISAANLEHVLVVLQNGEFRFPINVLHVWCPSRFAIWKRKRETHRVPAR